MVRLWDTAAQYPLFESIQGGTIHQWLWKAVPLSLYCLGRSACRLKFWHKGQGTMLCDLQLRSSKGDIATRPFTILYIIIALHLVLLSANGCHCKVFSINVTLLVCRQSFITNRADRLCTLSTFWMLTLVNGSQTVHAYSSNWSYQCCVAYSLCSLWTVLQVSLNKGPGRVGFFGYVFNVCVPVDGFVDGYS